MGSFAGRFANPVADARLAQSMSGPALAKRLGLSRQYISRVEQGTYSKLNPALQKWTAEALNINLAAVSHRYEVFQKASRIATKERFNPHKLERHGSSLPGHVIFERWRSGYWTSPVQFAVAFCVHPDMVQKYEENIVNKMPQQVFEALLEVKLIDNNWSETFESLGAAPRG